MIGALLKMRHSGFLLLALISTVQGARFSAVGGIYNYSHPETAPDQGVDPPNGDILQVECTDSSGNPLDSATYTITSGNSDPFQINTTTGQLSWREGQVLDYENVTFYWFSIECVDNSDPTNIATAMANVSVLPVNEFTPTITSGSAVSLTITDDSPVGSVLLSTEPGAREQYRVEDLDDGPDGQITFTLSSQSNSDFLQLFQLNSSTGALSIAQSLVDSTVSFTTGRITVCDVTPPRDECPNLVVTILIRDAPPMAEYDPLFNRSRVEVDLPESAESGTLVATTMCSDQDIGLGAYEGIDIYSVTPISLRNSFRLNSTEDGYGIVSLQKPIDYEMLQPQEIINVTLRCFDNQPTPREDFVEIVINVLPVSTSISITETPSTLGTTEIIIIVVVCCGALILCLFVALFCCCCICICRRKSTDKQDESKHMSNVDMEKDPNTELENEGSPDKEKQDPAVDLMKPDLDTDFMESTPL